MSYDADATRAFFDAYGEREWDRLEQTLQGRVKYAVHRHLLEEYVRPGMRVLDVGSGPGRFAIDVVQMGARVTLVDISQVQLDLARDRLGERGLLDGVDGFHRLDVLDLSSLGTAFGTALGTSAYDVVLGYGGVVSYTTRRHVDALRELARVTRPGGAVLVSVMSLYGALRLLGPLDAAKILESPRADLEWDATLAGDGVVYTVAGSREWHRPLALFTAEGLRGAMREAGLAPERTATSNPLFPEFLSMPRVAESERAAAELIALEVSLCERPGLQDAGGHLIMTARV